MILSLAFHSRGVVRVAASMVGVGGAVTTEKRRGALIVLEGLDRSGKSSQCKALASFLRSRGESVEEWRFPDRTTAIGQMISSYLTGASELDDSAIHLLFSANRWEKR
jgi:dTMP kinase